MLFKDFYRYANEGSFPGATRKSKKKTLWISNVWQKLETHLEEKPSIPTVFWKIAFEKGHRRSQVAYGKTGARTISAIFGCYSPYQSHQMFQWTRTSNAPP